MKQRILLIYAFIFIAISSLFGQKISETGFELGLNKTSSPEYEHRWNDSAAPSYFIFKTSESWYNKNQKFPLRKQLGLNLQYAGIDLSGGGLGGGSYYTGNIISLFADAALLVHFQLSKRLGLGIGPEAEILIIGKNDLNNSYFMAYYDPPISGDKRIEGFNRDYFNQPNYGIKLSFFETGMDKKINFGFNFSYLWTKSEYSNFYASNYARFSLYFGLRNKNKNEH